MRKVSYFYFFYIGVKKMKLLFFLFICLINCTIAIGQFLPEFREALIEKPNYYIYENYFEQWSKINSLEKTKGWKWYQRLLENEKALIYSDGSYLTSKEYINIINEIEALKAKKTNEIQLQSGWLPIGPNTRGRAYDSVSAHGIGRINTIAFHPTNKDVFWIGTPNGGIWKTLDQGKKWFPVSDYLPSIKITDIEVDPNDGDILYASTGDADAINWITNSTAMGIFKSTDGGLQWEPTGLSYTSSTFNRSYIRKIIVHKENSNNLIAAGTYGLWKSSDAGSTWEKIMDSLMIVDLKQDPANLNTLYAATQWFYGSFSKAGIIKSSDFGANWVFLNSEIPPENFATRTAVAISPANPNYVYAIAVSRATNGLLAFYRSTDAGETWVVSFNASSKFNIMGWYDGDSTDQGGQGTYDLTLICDRNDKNKVISGGVNLWGTTDAGDTWEIATLWIDVFDKTIHADQHYSEYNPLDEYYYFCNDGGVFRTKEVKLGKKEWIAQWVDRAKENVKPGYPGFNIGTDWENISESLAITELYRISLSRDVEGFISGGSQDNSSFYWNNTEWINYVTNYDGMETMIHHTNPEVLYGASQFGRLCRSTDGCKTQECWLTDTISNSEGNGSWITPFVMDPVNPDIIYAGFKNVWKSTNRGNNWTNILDFKSGLSGLTSNINYMAISRTNPEIIAVSKPNGNRWRDSLPHELWITKNGGSNWYKAEGLASDSIQILALDITDDNKEKIYAALAISNYPEQKVFVSDDYGKSWKNITKNLPNVNINAIIHQDNSEKNIVYIGTNNGVFYTHDEFESWIPLNENLPNTIVRDMEINYHTQKLYAATYGRGFWMTDLLNDNVSVNEISKIDDFTLSPNPNNGLFSVITNKDLLDRNLKMEIIDIFGTTLYTEQNYNFKSEKSISVDFPSGQYYLKLSDGNTMKAKKFLIIR